MATRRTHLGLRRGRPRLSAAGTRHAVGAGPSLAGAAGAAAALALALLLPGCSSTGENEEERFSLYHENSLNYYDRGSYPQALHQANMALAIEPEDFEVLLIKAFCLIKLGKASGNPIMLDESVEIFEALLETGDGRDKFQTWFGLGSACLARSFEHQAELERIRKRLGSEFLSAEARQLYEEALRTETAAYSARLEQGEDALRRVLDFPLQKDNAYALVDLVLTLNALGSDSVEALSLAERALVQLDESTQVTQNQLQKTTKLSAAGKVDLEQRIANNREKETMLRDLVATMHYNAGDMDGFFRQMRILEERKLMGEVQYFNRAAVHEQLGNYGSAADDLEQFLRLRGRRLEYDEDDMAPEVFARIETLRSRRAEPRATAPR
jgi:tetratricopeptide (TPR) repeat protein